MQKIIYRVFFLVLILSLFVSMTAMAAQIATVIAVSSGVTVERAGKVQPLALKDSVQTNDIIRTDATGKLQLIFQDDTTVSIGVNSIFTMEDYTDAHDKAFKAYVKEGFARFVTGAIVEGNPEVFSVRTPQATVGIRGTTLAILTRNSVTTVSTENSTKQQSVIAHGTVIPTGYTASFRAGGNLVSPPMPMTNLQRQQLVDEVAMRGRVSNTEAQDLPVVAAFTFDDENNFKAPESLQATLTQSAFERTDIEAEGSGSFSFGQSRGTFSFEANLRTGMIEDVELETNLSVSGAFSVEDGTGRINATNFEISGGEAELDGADVNSWNMTGNQSITSANQNIDGSLTIVDNTSSTLSGSFQGTVKPD